MDTTRGEIATCMQKAYTVLSVKAAMQLLRLKSDAELADFAKNRKWTVDSAKVRFAKLRFFRSLIFVRMRSTLSQATQAPSRQFQRWSLFIRRSHTRRNWKGLCKKKKMYRAASKALDGPL